MTHRFCEVSTVTILVGKDKKPFCVHEDQLCEVSSFFKAAFTSGFREASDKKMELVEEDEDTFDRFIQWLYSQQYEMPGEETEGGGFMEPLKLFVLAEKFDVSKLKSLLMTRMFAMGKRDAYRPQLDAIAYAYAHTSTSSKIRKLLADWYACKISYQWYKDDPAQKLFRENPEFTTDVLVSLAKHTCRFHLGDAFKGDMPGDYKEKASKQEK